MHAEVDDEPYRYHKLKLPQGESHPLKRGELDALMDRRLSSVLGEVTLWRQMPGYESPSEYFPASGWKGRPPVAEGADWRPLLAVDWRGPRHAVGDLASPGAHLWVYAVPSGRRAELRTLLLDEALPAAMAWIREIADGPETRSAERAKLLLYLLDGVLQRAEC